MSRGPPPAAKEEIEKLEMEAVTETVLARIGEGMQCAVCREALAVGDILQQMPCLHPYHPECLKPWLVSDTHFQALVLNVESYNAQFVT